VERLLKLVALLLFAAAGAARAATDLHVSVELGWAGDGRYDGFLDGGLGKTPYGSDPEVRLMDGYFEARTDLGSQWDAKLTLTGSQELDEAVAVSEATLTWRPLPASGRRLRMKLGAFRPPVSFEHGDEGWSSTYTLNASAINSWIGQEVGGLGAEVRVASDPATSAGPLDWDLFAATFFGNDPSGTLLAWSGWSFWSGQSRWGDRIPLGRLPLLQYADYQAPVAEPFVETDGQPGYWLGGTLGASDRFRLRYVHYDNRADPNSKGNGQWGWRTRFHSIGAQFELPFQIGLIAQALRGDTCTWEIPYYGDVVDADYDSEFVMLTRAFGAHRASVRYDQFAIHDRDVVPIDPNGEDGSAWTLSYKLELGSHWHATAELLRIESERPARTLRGLPDSATENVLYFTLGWTL
jgi:hypothetical protein